MASIGRIVHAALPPKVILQLKGFFTFMLSDSIRFYAPLRFPVELSYRFPLLVYQHMRFKTLFAPPPTPEVYVDATPSVVAFH